MNLRKPLHLTIDFEIYKALKRNKRNISKYVEKLIINDFLSAAKNGIGLGPISLVLTRVRTPSSSLLFSKTSDWQKDINSSGENYAHNCLNFNNSKQFFEWVNYQDYTNDHIKHLTSYYKRCLQNKSFNMPFELQKHIQSFKRGINNIITAARAYLKFLEQTGLCSTDIIDNFRKVLIIKKKRKDFFVPSDVQVIDNYNKIKANLNYEIVYLVLATSGIRYIECLKFLRTYDINKFVKHNGFVSYDVSELRHTKNINKIYLPLFVYEKLRRVTNTYNSLRRKYKDKGCTFSLKYLRKWQYNFLIYNKVPESVADFIQGRVSKSIGANHYLAKSQQGDYWYEKVVVKLSFLKNN